MNNLAIIPARGGSKRILGKNIKSFLGKPILEYSINAAIKSNLFSEVMVSTDSDEIAQVAKRAGADIPFIRSEENANDYATLADVINEVLKVYEESGKKFDNVCCILPTAPFVTNRKIADALKVLNQNKFDTVFPVIEFSYPIQRSLKFTGDKIQMVDDKYLNTRSQDLDSRYHDAGQFYWINAEVFVKNKKLFTDNSGAIIISELEAQDIDTMTDWQLAEIKYKMMLENEKNNL